MTPAEQAAREQLIAVIMRGLKAYAPDEAETYGHDEAEMIADYVAPYVAQVIEQARREEREACILDAQEHSCRTYSELCDCPSHIVKAIRARAQESEG